MGIRTVWKEVDYTALNTPVVIAGTVKGDIVVNGGAYIVTGFNGTTPTLDVGFAGDNQGGAADDNALASALTASAVGSIVFDELATTTNKRCTTPDQITATFKVASGTPSAGKAVVWAFIVNVNPLNDNI
jgi:hypothetical protein